ncbi:MAG: hypothetical protein ACYCWE_06575 [Eubacteriales bacterium]
MAFLIITPAVLSACASPAAVTAETTPAATEEITMSEEEKAYAGLAAEDVGGYEFTILQYLETAASTTTVCVEELNGETLNDVIYNRTQTVNDRLNVNIQIMLETVGNVNTKLKSAVIAGDDIYDVVWQHSSNMISNFLVNRYLLNMNTIQSFDFSNPWWNKSAIEAISIGPAVYLAFGDISFYLYDFHSILAFNSKIIEDYTLNEPYELVNAGTWTADKFKEMVKQVSADLDGDGTISNKTDMLGFTGRPDSTIYGFLHAADVSLFKKDSDNYIVFEGINQTYFDVLSSYSEVLGDKTLAFNNFDEKFITNFPTDRFLFTSCGVGELSALRDMESSYGVIPFPKRDDAQENYISFVTDQIQPMGVPITASDAERTGIILENLAAESRRQARDVYFDVMLNYKYVRDEISIEMLRLIYSSETRFEIENMYGWSSIAAKVVSSLSGSADKFISDAEKLTPALITAIEKTNEYLDPAA